MPHQVQQQLIKRRLIGKEGSERLRELRTALTQLPNYKNGPYADLRKWVMAEIEATRARARVVQRDSLSVRREGVAQIALVGPPNAGKSSLLQAISEIQIKIGSYAFTTLRPVPALVRLRGVLVQFVEIPGLVEGATEDRGGGRSLLGVLRGADAIIYCQDASGSPSELAVVRNEVITAGIDLPAIIAATKMDEAGDPAVSRLQAAFPGLTIVPVSVIDDASLERFKEAAWGLLGLMCVYLRRSGVVDEEPLALPLGATVLDAAREIHNELASTARGARVWGPSARFDGQLVGLRHEVKDGDAVEIITRPG
jgi:small GTP-binding protein